MPIEEGVVDVRVVARDQLFLPPNKPKALLQRLSGKTGFGMLL